jgi:DNA-binding response OmpR family regulator
MVKKAIAKKEQSAPSEMDTAELKDRAVGSPIKSVLLHKALYFVCSAITGTTSSSASTIQIISECHIDRVHSIEETMDYVKLFVPDSLIIDSALGDEACLTLCRHWKASLETLKTPILLIVNYETSTDRRWEWLVAGIDDFLIFPCDIPEIITRVRILLRMRQAEIGLWEANRRLMGLAEERSRALFIYDSLNRFLLDNCTNPILIFELNENIEDSRFLDANSIVYRITGYSREDFLQLRLRDIIPPNRARGIEDRIECITQIARSLKQLF